MGDGERILIVDDDANIRRTLSDIIAHDGYTPVTAATGATALKRVAQTAPAVALIDLQLSKEMDGIELIERMQDISPLTENIIITGYASQKAAIAAVNHGCFGFIEKPFAVEPLLLNIRRAVEKHATTIALQESEARYRATFENTGTAMVIVDADKTILLANKRFAKLVGWSRKTIEGHIPWTVFIVPEDLQRMKEQHQIKRRRREDALRQYEFHLIDRHGTIKNILLNVDMIPGTDRSVASMLDITKRKHRELELQQTLIALKRSNRDLEQFAYVASHDLQEPLRMISSYIQLLAKRYRGQLDDDADEFIDYVVGGAKRLQALILALLDYSRVRTRGQPLAPTDMNSVMEGVLTNFKLAIDDSDAEVTCDVLPTVNADAAQMAQLLQNLIANALKFHGDDPPRIHVSAERHDTGWRFAVRDNGLGIDPKYHERIFIIFQRLHARDDFDGTGIGLSVVKSIVQRHGGRAWIESEPGAGATFYFTIPMAPDGSP